jgi:hypothetical protein
VRADRAGSNTPRNRRRDGQIMSMRMLRSKEKMSECAKEPV